jgi:hypothetical protein
MALCKPHCPINDFFILKHLPMGTNWGTAIIGIISMLVIVIPVIILHYKKARKENNILHFLNKFTQPCASFRCLLPEQYSRLFVYYPWPVPAREAGNTTPGADRNSPGAIH